VVVSAASVNCKHTDASEMHVFTNLQVLIRTEGGGRVRPRWDLVFGLCPALSYLLILCLHTASPLRAVCHYPCRQLQMSDTAPYALRYICLPSTQQCCVLKTASTSKPGADPKVQSKSGRIIFTGHFDFSVIFFQNTLMVLQHCCVVNYRFSVVVSMVSFAR
jgi:hypothetical protein